MQEDRAAMIARMRENAIYRACPPPDKSPFKAMWRTVSSIWQMPGTRSDCEKHYIVKFFIDFILYKILIIIFYIQDMLSQPEVNVSPARAVAVTASEFFVTPLKMVIDAFGQALV